jgi:hypothetical protein
MRTRARQLPIKALLRLLHRVIQHPHLMAPQHAERDTAERCRDKILPSQIVRGWWLAQPDHAALRDIAIAAKHRKISIARGY